jgi:glutaminyl-peptide cyclotransferase
MIGDADATFYKGCGSDTDLANRLWEAAARLDVHQFKEGGGCGAVDDHMPFEEMGVKTVDIIPPFGPGTAIDYWHTTEDTPDKLDIGFMGDIGRILLEVLSELEGPLPIRP